jgi:hypothetical protein
LGAAICFESCFPSIFRQQTAQGASLLLVSASDVIFRRTALAMNHAYLSVFRAAENNRYLVRAANAGPSMIISPRGEILKQSSFYSRGILFGEISPITKKTIYTRWGYFIPILMAFFILCLCLKTFVSERDIGKQENKHLTWRHKKTKTREKVKLRSKKHDVNNNQLAEFVHNIKWHRAILVSGIHIILIFIVILSSICVLNAKTESGMNCKEAIFDFINPGDIIQPEQVTERFLQVKKNTCGPSALAYLMSFYGRDTMEAEVVADVVMQKQGTSMHELVKAAEGYGFKAWGEKQNYAALKEQPIPLIAFINNDHYVVVIRVLKHFVELFDPAIGHLKITRKTFERAWNGYVLIIRVKPIQTEI